jgi:hypothetical protein
VIDKHEIYKRMASENEVEKIMLRMASNEIIISPNEKGKSSAKK